MPTGGYSRIVNALFERCKPELKLGQKVKKIDYSGVGVNVVTNMETFTCRCLISSLPLGVLKSKQVEFVPDLPLPYRMTIGNMGFGVANKIYASFYKPFWGKKTGWLNFYSTSKTSRYPNALVVPESNQPILMFFVSGNESRVLSEWKEEEVKADLESFLSKCVQEEVRIKSIKMTKWHKD